MYRLRVYWPAVAGAGIGVVALGLGVMLGEEAAADRHVLGIQNQFWAVAFVAVTVGLVLQLVVSNRAALRRERNLVRTAAQLREVSAELDRLARTDALTGIANRRAFFDVLGVEFRRSRRYGRQLSVLMLDLDHFKDVNDRWGHPFGDHVLRQVADIIATNVRESDILGRYGGEEFAVALPETTVEGAEAVGEKLRQAVEAHEFRAEGIPPDGEPPVRITVSIGVAALPVEEDQDEVELIGRADQALYEAKRTGRNRVVRFRKPEGIVGPASGASASAGGAAAGDATP